MILITQLTLQDARPEFVMLLAGPIEDRVAADNDEDFVRGRRTLRMGHGHKFRRSRIVERLLFQVWMEPDKSLVDILVRRHPAEHAAGGQTPGSLPDRQQWARKYFTGKPGTPPSSTLAAMGRRRATSRTRRKPS